MASAPVSHRPSFGSVGEVLDLLVCMLVAHVPLSSECAHERSEVIRECTFTVRPRQSRRSS